MKRLSSGQTGVNTTFVLRLYHTSKSTRSIIALKRRQYVISKEQLQIIPIDSSRISKMICTQSLYLFFPKMSNEIISSPLLELDTDDSSVPPEEARGVLKDTRFVLAELNLGEVEAE